jgi:hypothetical protein
MEYSLLAVAVLQVAFQLLAAFFAFRIIQIIGGMRPWGVLITGLLIMAIRRTITLLASMEVIPYPGLVQFLDVFVLPLAISFCMMFSMWDLLQLFKRKYGK